ncbi:MAG: hypothetical protein DRJ52_01970 [Thermoprotei archaeon]|nr:MAG: hypothetical protein DRJ52_01970 [Thermoprotei archaeon]RLE99915.1 MAG: hypothetical protein DRJ63_03955 [Thermoprotei archaeon]
MGLTSLRYLPASRGTLLKLRRQLELAKRGKSVLEMRRDQLVKEIFTLIDRLKERPKIEEKYIKALEDLSLLRLKRGEVEFFSIVSLVRPPVLEVLAISIEGVSVPQIKILRKPDYSLVKDPEYRTLLENAWQVIEELIEVTNIEIAVEKLCAQLSYINRVVNSLEENFIPKLEETIRYIGEKIEEEMLEEFVRLKNIAR